MTSRVRGECRTCGLPIVYGRGRGFNHDVPLGKLRILASEAALIAAAPPPGGMELGRDTFIHQARP